MELALSLGGDNTPKPILFLEKSSSSSSSLNENKVSKDDNLGFCMVLGKCNEGEDEVGRKKRSRKHQEIRSSIDPSLQLDLLPFSPGVSKNTPSQLSFPWLSQNLAIEPAGLTNGPAEGKALEMNRMQLVVAEEGEEGAALSSPNSEISSFQMNFPIYKNGKLTNMKRDQCERYNRWGNNINNYSCSRASDEELDASARKKLRLTKEQSAFLEESFKEHNTLNPKQKLALAKQLNLRPRQVEVWFQNRRARTKLKQTEVDCEYLKKCCETLTEENKRLHKELQELRALKSSQPFYMQLPATTLTMCPSCERVATTTTSAITTTTVTLATTTTTATATATAPSNTLALHNHKLISLMTK